jgi:hypothetical protein
MFQGLALRKTITNRRSIMSSRLLQVIASVTFALVVAAPTWADTPGKHPAYLHALSDLRDARAHLERVSSDPVNQEQDHAIVAIDRAIDEIKRAAIMDGKNIADHMPVDAHLPLRGRFHKALELLNRAKADVSGEEDQPDTQGLQLRVIHHIDEAHHAVKHAIDIIQGGA